MSNNPINRIDPSGHDDWYCQTASCSYNYYHHNNYNFSGELSYIKERMTLDYGVTLSDSGAKSPEYEGSQARAWDLQNTCVVDYGMAQVDQVLNGNTKNIIKSATFTLNTYDNEHFFGCTACNGSSLTNVDFYTDSAFPVHNLYHEFGHVLDNSPGNENEFSGALGKLTNPAFLNGNNLSGDALMNGRLYGPYNGVNGAKAL
ncbi:MAG TPA: hypothetical protein VK141_08655 [Nitrosomonas sp.]|nr:hypothetical protein [Nitrosomonas sp.]